MSTHYKISVPYRFCKLSNGNKLEITILCALYVFCQLLPNILKNIQTCARRKAVNSKKRAQLTCYSNRRLTFSLIFSIAIAIAIAIAFAIAIAIAIAIAVTVTVAVAVTVADAVAVAARYDTIYFTLYPMYSGVASNCYGLAHRSYPSTQVSY